MKINELIVISTNNVPESFIADYISDTYSIISSPDHYSPLVKAIHNNVNADNECVTDSLATASQIIGDLYFQYLAGMQDFNVNTRRDELLQSINKISSNSKLTNTNSNSTIEAADSTAQAYVQNQSQESDTAWNNNKFRDSATQNNTNSTTTNSSTGDSNQTSDTTQTSNPALIRFTRELRNLNIFAGKLWQNLVRTCVINLSLPFETEGQTRRGLPTYFSYE